MTSIIFFASGLSLLTSIGQLFLPERRYENYNLSMFFFIFGVLNFQIGLILNGIVFEYPEILILHVTFIYLAAPLLSFAFYLVIFPVETFTSNKLLYLSPVIIALIADLYFITIPHEQKIILIYQFFNDAAESRIILAKAILSGGGILMVFYHGIVFKKIVSERNKKNNKHDIMRINLIYIVLAPASLIILLSGYLFSSKTIITIYGIFSSSLLIGAYLVGFRHPKFLQLFFIEVGKKYYKRSLLDKIKVDDVIEELEVLMNDKKLYLDDTVSLKILADKLSITTHQLSQLLNDRFKMNFNIFINQYRIRDAKEILINEPKGSVLSIAFKVGFNSKSSFFKAFYRLTEKTPNEFRKENLPK